MILIIGGIYQGKQRFALKMSKETKEDFEVKCANGATDDFSKAIACPYVEHYEEYIRRHIEFKKDFLDFTKQVICGKPQIVMMDEVGCGVVPVDGIDRRYREAVGEVGQLLAQEATAVYRVICGIATQIK